MSDLKIKFVPDSIANEDFFRLFLLQFFLTNLRLLLLPYHFVNDATRVSDKPAFDGRLGNYPLTHKK